MTSRQEKLIENYVRQKVKKMLKENPEIDPNDQRTISNKLFDFVHKMEDALPNLQVEDIAVIIINILKRYYKV